MSIFIEHLELLKQLGAIHLGYYPDNVFKDQPRLEDLQRYFSLTGLQ
jgi:poly-beta-1,6-N-acetyl-D-glucosamine N-deacetylase